MATLVPLKEQLKQTVKGDKKMSTKPIKNDSTSAKKSVGKTGPLLPGKSVARVKEVKEKGESKMSKAIDVYNKMLDKPRKEVLLAFISDCGLTTAGASTYYSLIKKSAE